MKTCVCGSQKPFEKCCGRFLQGGLKPKTPEQLMRSRYAAYALGSYGDYLLDTWFPATAGQISAADLSLRSCNWQGLQVLDKSQKGDEGMVEFKASFTEHGATEIKILHERSVFKRIKGRWLYVGAEVQGANE